MQLLRQHYRGPIYCDLHSLLLAIEPNGLRTPQPLGAVAEWCRCADFIQVNEDEMNLMASDPVALAATALAAGVRCLSVTLGSRGVVYFAPPDFEAMPDLRTHGRAGALGVQPGPVRTALVPAVPAASGPTQNGDPTGCGDVWGATYFSRLLAGDKLADAMHVAVTAAARNVGHRGATGLAHHLRGELSPR
jgi:sugar/nucleoside kinase (ribokinase family)